MIFIDVIHKLERRNSSVNGNPAFDVYFLSDTTVAHRTQTDANISYGLENRENFGTPVLVRTTDAGRIYDVRPLKGSFDLIETVVFLEPNMKMSDFTQLHGQWINSILELAEKLSAS